MFWELKLKQIETPGILDSRSIKIFPLTAAVPSHLLSSLGYPLRSPELPSLTSLPVSSFWLAPDPIRPQSAAVQSLHVNTHGADILVGLGYRLFTVCIWEAVLCLKLLLLLLLTSLFASPSHPSECLVTHINPMQLITNVTETVDWKGKQGNTQVVKVNNLILHLSPI